MEVIKTFMVTKIIYLNKWCVIAVLGKLEFSVKDPKIIEEKNSLCSTYKLNDIQIVKQRKLCCRK